MTIGIFQVVDSIAPSRGTRMIQFKLKVTFYLVWARVEFVPKVRLRSAVYVAPTSCPSPCTVLPVGIF